MKDAIQIVVQQDKQAKGVKMQNKRVAGTTINFDNKSENPYGQQQPGGKSPQTALKNSRNEQKRLAQHTDNGEKQPKAGKGQPSTKSERHNRSTGPKNGRAPS